MVHTSELRAGDVLIGLLEVSAACLPHLALGNDLPSKWRGILWDHKLPHIPDKPMGEGW